MRSLKYLSAFLPLLNSIHVSAEPARGGTVIVTTTRTVTVCPIQTWIETCDGNDIPTYTSRSGAPTLTSSTTTSLTTSHSGGDGSSTSGGSGGSGTTTSTSGGNGGTTTSGGNGGNGTVTTTTSGGSGGNGTTTTTPITTTTSGSGNGTTTTTTSTTTSGCFNSTRTANPIADNDCNAPGSRNTWCGGRSINTDTHNRFTTGDTKTFDLSIEDAILNPDGMGNYAGFTINGKTPGEAIVANWGDTVVIRVTNNMRRNGTTIHWHGILQVGTNDQDGVPGVTECAIAPGQSRTYTWHASTYGTGWYHSHLMSQYGGGIRGPVIIHGPASSDYDLDMGPVMLDEKFDVPVFDKAKYWSNSTAPPLTATNYLVNGKNTNPNATAGEATRFIVKEGKKHLFRIINSSAQSTFTVEFDSHNMTVISADYTPIEPYVTKSLHLTSGQRYNVIVTADQPPAAYYLRAITQTACGIVNANNGLGVSNAIIEYEGSCTTIPAANSTTTTSAATCIDEPLASLIPIVAKTGGDSSLFDSNGKLLPAGNAARFAFAGLPGTYVQWMMGAPTALNSPITGANRTINVNFTLPSLELLNSGIDASSAIFGNTVVLNGSESTWAYFVITNNFATSHPMHLHGHDFAVLGQAYGTPWDSSRVSTLNFNNPIRRDTALLFGQGLNPNSPGYTVIGFPLDNPGAWVMHCHIIWHADLGMGMQFIERPGEISAYASKEAFNDECESYKAFEASNPGSIKLPYEAGIKRHLDEHKFRRHE